MQKKTANPESLAAQSPEGEQFSESQELQDLLSQSVSPIDLERRLRHLWQQYVESLDQQADPDRSEQLKSAYSRLYDRYREHRRWVKIVGDQG